MKAKAKAGDKPKEFRCGGCGGMFEYVRRPGRKWARKPKYCDDCRKLKENTQIHRYKQQMRKLLKQGDKSEHFHRYGLIAQMGGVGREEAAEAMGIKAWQVEELERRVLLKIRTNPELVDLWTNVKEQLDGAGGMDGMKIFPPNAAGRGDLILDYQQALADWWQTYDEIIANGCTLEALELLAEIERFRRKIEKILTTDKNG